LLLAVVGLSSVLTNGVASAAKSEARPDSRTKLRAQVPTSAAQVETAMAPDLPNFDAFASSSRPGPASPTAPPQAEAGHLILTDPRLGVPTFLWASDPGQARALPTQLQQRRAAAEESARQHL